MTIWPHKLEERMDLSKILPHLKAHCEADRKLEYFVAGYETVNKKGEDTTPHYQSFAYWENALTMRGVMVRLGLLPGEAHVEAMRGTAAQASDYASKDTVSLVHGVVPDPEDRPESAWDYILKMVENGDSDAEIMRAYPAQFGRCSAGIAKMRMELLAEQINTWRPVEVQYVWGPTGSGKTRTVLEGVEHPSDVFRVTDFKHPFDNYRGQKVLMLEEFRSSLSIEDMLIWLDGYYCELPCRYSNKVSGWDTVFIVTNIPLEQQYPRIQRKHPETWAAFLRRLSAQVHMGHREGNNDPLGSVASQESRLGLNAENREDDTKEWNHAWR